jgi:hypothetical protein
MKKINVNEKKSLYCWHKKKSRKKYLRQTSIDFHFCNVSSSCDVVYKGRWLTQAGYWFILRFCEHFTCLSSKIQNAIKLENISNLITSPSSYQCIRKKTWSLVHFPVIHESWPTLTRIIQSLYYSPASRCLIQRKCR